MQLLVLQVNNKCFRRPLQHLGILLLVLIKLMLGFQSSADGMYELRCQGKWLVVAFISSCLTCAELLIFPVILGRTFQWLWLSLVGVWMVLTPDCLRHVTFTQF